MYFGGGEEEEGKEEEPELKFSIPVKIEREEESGDGEEEQDEFLKELVEHSCSNGGDEGKRRGRGQRKVERVKRQVVRKKVMTEEQRVRKVEAVRKRRERLKMLAETAKGGRSASEEARIAAEKLEAQRERDRQRKRAARAKWTKEQRKQVSLKETERKRRLMEALKGTEEGGGAKEDAAAKKERARESERLRMREKRARMTEEERKEYRRKEMEKRREERLRKRETMSQEELEKIKEKDRERQRRRRVQMGPEQRKQASRCSTLWKMKKKATMTEEERKEYKMKMYMARVAKMAAMTEVEKEERRQKMYFKHRKHYESLTVEQKKKQVERQRELRKKWYQDQQKRQKHLEKLRENYRKRVERYKQKGPDGVMEMKKRRKVEEEKQKLRRRLVKEGVEAEEIKKQVKALADRLGGSEGYKLLLKYKCNLCDPLRARFGEKWELEGHRIQCHPEMVKVKKGHIGRKKDPQVSLRRERRTEVQRTATHCEICGRVVAVKSLSIHYDKMHGVKEEPFECLKKCGRVFMNRDTWLMHMEVEYGIRVEDIGEEVRRFNVKERDKVVIKNPEGYVNGVKPAKEGPRKSHVSIHRRASKVKQGGDEGENSRKSLKGRRRGGPYKLTVTNECPSEIPISSRVPPPPSQESEHLLVDYEEQPKPDCRFLSQPHTSQHPASSAHFSFPPNTSTIVPPTPFNFFDQMNYHLQNYQPSHHPQVEYPSAPPADYHHVYPKSPSPASSPPGASPPHNDDQDDFDSDSCREMERDNNNDYASPPLIASTSVVPPIKMERRSTPKYQYDAPKKGRSYDWRHGLHNPREGGNKDTICDSCGNAYNSKYKRMHLEDYHNPYFVNGTCTPCGVKFKRRRKFANHFNKCHPELKDPALIVPKGRTGRKVAKPDDVVCSKCGMGFSKSYIQKHMDLAHNPNYVDGKCKECLKEFGNCTDFYTHFKSEHPMPSRRLGRVRRPGVEANEICDTCGLRFTNKYSLQGHIYKMHGEGSKEDNWLQCSMCPKKMKDKYALKYHVSKNHGGVENAFMAECAKCGKKFEGREQLKEHVGEEHPQEYFPCKMCTTFRHSQSGLYLHRMRCTKVKKKTVGEGGEEEEDNGKEYVGDVRVDRIPTPCMVCEKVIALDGLRKHVEDIHGVKEDPFECDRCDQQFSTRSAAWYHLEMKHGLGEEEVVKQLRKVFVRRDREGVEFKKSQKFVSGTKPRKKRAYKRWSTKNVNKEYELLDSSDSEVEKEKEAVEVIRQPTRRSGRRKCLKNVKEEEKDELLDSSDGEPEVEEEQEEVIMQPTRRSVRRKCLKNVEVVKRLVISVVRLTEAEISFYCKANEGLD